MKKNIIRILALTIILAVTVTACTKPEDGITDIHEDDGLIVVGFSQVGSESSWRVAHSESIKDSLSEENGYRLIFDDAKQKQENQYKAIRRFIQQGVDYIVLAPITETGWDDVIREARYAGIPVIIVDRQVSVDDKNIYNSWVGSDFMAEGTRAMEWLEQELCDQQREEEEIRILHLQGTPGATAQLMRTGELEKAVEAHENWTLVGTLEGEYTEAKSYELTKEFLTKDTDIDVVYCENDNMAFGVMRALDDFSIPYGSKNGGVIIISFDAVKSALEACYEGKIDLCVECNPLHGPLVDNIIKQLNSGQYPAKMKYIQESLFSYREITREIIDARKY